MAKRKLTEKLKKQIKETPYRLRQADFSGDALKYLHKIRGARKAVKTREAKRTYKEPKKKSEGAPFDTQTQIQDAAKTVNLTAKQFKKKFPEETADFEAGNVLPFSRDIELLKKDISFNVPKGQHIFNNGEKISRNQARYLLVRLQNKMQASAIIYDRIPIEHYYDGKKNLHIAIPEPREYNYLQDEEILTFIAENYPNVAFYINPKKQKIKKALNHKRSKK